MATRRRSERRKRRRDASVSSHECEFVEPPPKHVQSECPICLQILREPHLISCCGHNFCAACIERVEEDDKPCPLCKEPSFTTMANKGLKRTLNEFRVDCPHRLNGCEWVGELGKLNEHLHSDPQPQLRCQFLVVPCVLHHAGCEVTLPRKDMADHMKEDSVAHISFLAIENHRLTQQNAELEDRTNKQSQELARVTVKLEESRIQRQKLFRYCEMQRDIVPVTSRMAKFEELREKGTNWNSRPFYTSMGGYKVFLSVNPNGSSAGTGTHVSVYIHLMRGEFDSNLKWPFQGTFFIQLVNQLVMNGPHHSYQCRFTDATPECSTTLVTDAKISSGWGAPKFILHSQLGLNLASNCQYLKDDSLIFRIWFTKPA